MQCVVNYYSTIDCNKYMHSTTTIKYLCKTKVRTHLHSNGRTSSVPLLGHGTAGNNKVAYVKIVKRERERETHTQKGIGERANITILIGLLSFLSFLSHPLSACLICKPPPFLGEPLGACLSPGKMKGPVAEAAAWSTESKARAYQMRLASSPFLSFTTLSL